MTASWRDSELSSGTGSMGLEQGGWQQPNDLERLAGAMQAVEQACAALNQV